MLCKHVVARVTRGCTAQLVWLWCVCRHSPEYNMLVAFGGYNGKYHNAVSVYKLPNNVPQASSQQAVEQQQAGQQPQQQQAQQEPQQQQPQLPQQQQERQPAQPSAAQVGDKKKFDPRAWRYHSLVALNLNSACIVRNTPNPCNLHALSLCRTQPPPTVAPPSRTAISSQ